MEHVIQNFSALVHIVILHETIYVGYFLCNFDDIFSMMHTLQSNANEHFVFNRIMSVTHNDPSA
jgi:hypothetical protein